MTSIVQDTYEVLKSWQTLVAGLVGFGGLAWVTNRNARLDRARQEAADQALVIALTIELSQLHRELSTARRLMEEGGEQVKVGQARLRTVHKSAFFDMSLERTGTLDTDFLTAVLEFLFAKRDAVDRYGKAEFLDTDRAIAAIRNVENLMPAVVEAASVSVPHFDFEKVFN